KIEFNFGCEMELKNAADSYFGRIDTILKEQSASQEILDVPDAAAALTSNAINERAVLAKTGKEPQFDEEFIVWMPGPQKGFQFQKIESDQHTCSPFTELFMVHANQ
ncbi:MAG: hypothetical protein ACKPKO_19810, partial [Candidatus Fonsibacter sp.]